MALQMFVDSLDTIAEALREHYESHDGRFRLAFDGLDRLKNEIARAQSANDRVKQLEGEVAVLKAASAQAKRLEIEVAALKAAKRTKDVSAMTAAERLDDAKTEFLAAQAHRLDGLEGAARHEISQTIIAELMEQSFVQEFLAEVRAANEKRVDALSRAIQRETINQAATRLVKDLARPGCSEVLLPVVLERIDCEVVGEECVAFVKDVKGKRVSIDQLKDEFRGTQSLRALIQGTTEGEIADHQRKIAEMIGTHEGTRTGLQEINC